jgi:hypothetical protein
MLRLLKGKASDRKLRLFGCACVRRVWHLLTDERDRQAVDVAERYADRLATRKELRACRSMAFNSASRSGALAAWHITREATWDAAWQGALFSSNIFDPDGVTFVTFSNRIGEGYHQCLLLRCVFGNPFCQSAVLDPAWLVWGNGTVSQLAQAIYDDRAFDRMPILADALEEAGCADADILGHCRGPDPHVRGCWVIDLLLGKE